VLHTNACGDFTLIAREHWFDLRGYPESDFFSIHMDSAFCYTAHYGGAREEVLTAPMCVYHIEHGAGWTPKKQAELVAWLASRGIPCLDSADVIAWATQMHRLNRPIIFNYADWGLGALDLKETIPQRRLGAVRHTSPYSYAVPSATSKFLNTETHPVFAHFPTYAGVVEPGFSVDFLGARTRLEFVSGAVASPGDVRTQYPPVDDEYFEWIAILESILAAKGEYKLVELGAGYGRWVVRAACAIRRYRPTMPFHLFAVEAEPKHFQWLQKHILDNEIGPTNHTLLQTAVSDRAGEVMFYIGTPGTRENAAAEWYGQTLSKSNEVVDANQSNSYEGFDVVKFKSGWEAIKIRSVPLGEIVGDIERVDLIDMDIQGEEFKVVSSAIDLLNRNTVRMHIGTHEREIEGGLRKLLRAHGWQCRADFKCLETSETPWGRVSFGDGVQSWVNPRFF
jgi:FkbM family methyltransferase